VLIGPTQQGKTSGVQRFTLLHGLGLVKGDYTVGALAGLGDIGLLVLDNKEQANFTQELIDFCLFLATGAERGRSQVDGRLRTGDTEQYVSKKRSEDREKSILDGIREELGDRFVREVDGAAIQAWYHSLTVAKG